MRVFLDTNVLVSAFASRGLCSDLLELVLIEHDLITGRGVLAELRGALRTKIRLPAGRCEEIVEFVTQEASIVVERPAAVDCEADAADRVILGEALAAQAQAFVTGDAALVVLGELGGMSIFTPRQLWERLRKS